MSINRARKTAMFCAALCALPIAFAAQAPGLWGAVGLIGLACAGHQGFSANVYALPGDLFHRWMAGSVIGLGGLSGAIGGMLLATFAGLILESLCRFQPLFPLTALPLPVSLLFVHLLVPHPGP